jgi:hypothetical protein
MPPCFEKWCKRFDDCFTTKAHMSFRFFDWLTDNREVFAASKASLGFIWA